MDRVEKYHQIIHNILNEYYEQYYDPNEPTIDTSIVCDDEHGEYFLMRVGWDQETRIRRPVFYVRLRNQKFWIEEDWTADGISHRLLLNGVPNTDIVLAFNPPEVRHLTGFAVS